MGAGCCSNLEMDPVVERTTVDQGYLDLVREKYRLRRLPLWGSADYSGVSEIKEYPEHHDLCDIINEHGLTFRLEYLDFVQMEGFVPDGRRFPLGCIKTSYKPRAQVAYNKGERSKGRRLVIPEDTIDKNGVVSQVQGFLSLEDQTCGVWLFNRSGEVCAEFNPSGVDAPQGEKYSLNGKEQIVGYYIAFKKESNPYDKTESARKAVTGFGIVVVDQSDQGLSFSARN